MEAIDQALLCQQGKIRIVSDVMMLRDETKIGYAHKADHHDEQHYITNEERRQLHVVANESTYLSLPLSIEFWTNLYRYSETNERSIAIQWGGNNLQHSRPYTDFRLEKHLVALRYFSVKVLTIFFEIFTAYLFKRYLKTSYGNAATSKVYQKMPLK